MTRYLLLLKKQLGDLLPSRDRGKYKLSSFASILLMGVLIAGVIAAFVFIFSRFTHTYTAIKINRVADIPARQYELMSMAYFVLFIVCVASGVNRLCYTLFENSDINVLISMPFSALEIFLAKLTGIYLRQLALSVLFVFPVNFTFFAATDLINAYNVLMTFVVALILPIIPLAIASVIALPYYYVKRFVSSHYVLYFLVMTAIMACFCVVYSRVFDLAENMLNSGKLASLFNERVMKKIISFAAYDYPANLFANIMLQRDLGKSIGILAAITIGAAAIGSTIIHSIFIRVTQAGFAAHVPHVRKKHFDLRVTPRLLSLISKEFLLVLRTPGYSYMYFTTAIIMPIMTYYSARLGTSFIATTLGDASISFELCTFLVLLYGTLTNTFCSTSISRDGYMTMMQKTLPYSPAQILSAKLIFGGLVSQLSIIVSCIVLGATGLESSLDAFVTFISATTLSLAQMAFATRMDLNRPHFSKTDDGEIKEANSTVSTLILVGLIVCVAIGALLLNNVVAALINGGSAASTNKGLSYCYAIVIPFALLAAAAAFFFVNLKKVYANLDAEA